MNIHEHQAKELLKEFGAPVSKGVVIYSLNEIDENLNHHTYILGNDLTLPDIAWFIYVARLKSAKYPIHILHPNVNDWYESLLKKDVFAKETKIPKIVKVVSYLFYVIQKYSGWSIKRQLVG